MASLAAGPASGCLKGMQVPCTADLCMLITCERMKQTYKETEKEGNGG